jgi:hypothetical protein
MLRKNRSALTSDLMTDPLHTMVVVARFDLLWPARIAAGGWAQRKVARHGGHSRFRPLKSIVG